jgi:CRP-like cAMP-binding protein
LSLLAGIDAFRDMDQSERDRLERASTVLQPRDGSEIFSQGDPADAVYAIVGGDGHVRFGTADRSSETLMVAVCRQGDIFGEIGVIDGSARTSAAIVEGRVHLARIPASSFLAALSSSAGLGHVMCQMLARRLLWTVTLFQDASFERCDQAALRGLLRLFG